MSDVSKTRYCYVCGSEAVDNEHIPPTSWFPKGMKTQLITVPACERHNYDLHHDQEYVRAIVVTEQATNSFARQFSQEKVMRSITRSQRMFSDVLSGAEPTLASDGQPSAKLIADLTRFNRVFEMMAYGLYFHLTGKRYIGGFDIYSPNLTSAGPASENDKKYMTLVSQVAAKSNFDRVELPNEDVFALGVSTKNGFEFLYRLEFYTGFIVIAVSVPPWRRSLKFTSARA